MIANQRMGQTLGWKMMDCAIDNAAGQVQSKLESESKSESKVNEAAERTDGRGTECNELDG